MSVHTLLEPSKHLSIVQPQATDEGVNHIVAVVDDLIFDSSSRYALKLTKESFDWSCNGEIKDLGLVLNYPQAKKGTKYHRDLKTNWN